METINFVASIDERDIDLLLLEEFKVSLEFSSWFASLAMEGQSYSDTIGTWHSVCDAALGESDLIHLFKGDRRDRCAILIENKISAPQQPRQGERYQERGLKGVQDGKWHKFTTCLIAPEKYLRGGSYEAYDSRVSYESIMAWFMKRNDPRGRYRAQVINEAIEQNRRGYQPELDKKMTEFAKVYWQIGQEKHAYLNIEPPRDRPAESTWIMFKPDELPKNLQLAHQLDSGKVRLLIAAQGDRVERLSQELSSFFPTGFEVVKAAKSAALSFDVPVIYPRKEDAEDKRRDIEQALKLADQLASFARENIEFF